MQHRHVASVLFATLLFLAPGCSAFRLQAGFGFGLGADVQVFGMQHVGALVGRYHEYGLNYGRGSYCKTGYTVLGPFHSTKMTFEGGREIKHGCIGVMPGPLGLIFGDEPPAERWAMEFGVGLTALEIRMGFNPVAPFFEDDTPGEIPTVGPQPEWKPDGQGWQPPPTTASSGQQPYGSSGQAYGSSDQAPYGSSGQQTQQRSAPKGAPPPPPPEPRGSYCADCGARRDACGCPR